MTREQAFIDATDRALASGTVQGISKITWLHRLAVAEAEQKGLSAALRAILTRAGEAFKAGDDEAAEALRDLAQSIHAELMPSCCARLTDLQQRLDEYDEANAEQPPTTGHSQTNEESNV